MTSAWKRCMDCENEFIFKPWFGWDIELLMPGTQKRLLQPYRGMTPYQKRNRVKRKSKKEPWKNDGEKFYQSWNTFEHYLRFEQSFMLRYYTISAFFQPQPFSRRMHRNWCTHEGTDRKKAKHRTSWQRKTTKEQRLLYVCMRVHYCLAEINCNLLIIGVHRPGLVLRDVVK